MGLSDCLSLCRLFPRGVPSFVIVMPTYDLRATEAPQDLVAVLSLAEGRYAVQNVDRTASCWLRESVDAPVAGQRWVSALHRAIPGWRLWRVSLCGRGASIRPGVRLW